LAQRQLLIALHRGVHDSHQATLRAKKAVACLMFVSGQAMAQIEATLTQFGGTFGGAAGAIRGTATRTCDVLSTTARVAEILHPTLDLGDRIGRLAIRLTYGVPSAAAELARELGAELLRGDYCRLASAHLCEPEAIGSAGEEQLLSCLDNNRQKAVLVKRAALVIQHKRERAKLATQPILAPYQS
jgi:helicase